MNDLQQWVVYDKPKDYPTEVVVRMFTIVSGDAMPADEVDTFETIEQANKFCEDKGLTFIPPFKDDDPNITGVWM